MPLLIRSQMRAFIAARFTDDLNEQITPAIERAVFDMLINNTSNLAEDAAGLFTPIVANQYGTGHPAALTLMSALEYLYTNLGNSGGLIHPAAPTNGIVDDAANTFTFTLAVI